MKREELKTMGLTDEQIESVMAKNGAEVAALNTQITTLKSEKSQLENDKQVLEKEKGEKEKALNELQKNSITKEEYDKKVKEIEDNAKKEHSDYIFNELLKTAFKDAKVRNTENNINAVKGSLDLTKITTDKEGKSLIGIKEQLDALKKTDPHFFETKVGGSQQGEPDGNGGKGDDGEGASMASNFAKEANKSDSQETKSLFFN